MTTMPPPGGGRTNEPRLSFSDTLFRESSFELGKAEPFAKSLEEIASVAVLDAAAVWPSCSLWAAADDVARPMQGLGEAGPVPFLRNTYQMVSDRATDPVVSWGLSRDSFVVWDEHKLSKQVLPRYFKHSNFSSFIRQLNTTG